MSGVSERRRSYAWHLKTVARVKANPNQLRGWKQITEFLGMPASTAQRWARSGMPVTRNGRNVVASPDELNRWLDRETGVSPAVHVAAEGGDLSSDLKRAVAEARRHQKRSRAKR